MSDQLYLSNLKDNATGTNNAGSKSLDVNVTGGTLSTTEVATAPDGGALPALIKIVGGYDGANVQVISTDATGAVNVNATGPTSGTTGAAVPAKADYVAGNKGGNLTGLLIGQQTMANSAAVVIASDQSALPASQSGTWNITNVSGTVSLPTGAATAAKQPALGTAGTPSADVISVQGVAGGTPQPVSGTVTANIGTVGTLALDASVAALQVSQGSATSGQKGALALGAVTTAAPTYTTAQSSPLSLNTAGALRVTDAAVSTETTLAALSAKLPAALGQTTAAASMSVVLASNQPAVPISVSAPTAGTVTQAAIAVGASAVRLTVSGSAPSANRKQLIATIDPTSTATFYVGSATVTTTSTTRGVPLTAGQTFIANNDAGDYYIISSLAAQTVFVVEQA